MTSTGGKLVDAQRLVRRETAAARAAPTPARRVARAMAVTLFATAALLPLAGSDFHTRLAIEAALLGMLALSVDILLGRVGLLSLGQAAFFGIGAYTAALSWQHVSQSLWVVLLCVLACTTLVALAVGAVAIRSSGVYFALITFGVGEILAKSANNTAAVGGSDGLLGLPVPALHLPGITLSLADNTTFLYLALTMLLGTWLLVQRLLDTPFGSVLEALRHNPARVPYLGYGPFGYKLAAFVLAANVAALGGMLYPFLRGFVSPVLFGFEYSTKAVVMALVGGLGSLIGPVVGAAVITFSEDALSNVTRHPLFAIGALFVGFVLFAPAGMAGALRQLSTRSRRTGKDDGGHA
ncbi:MAG: branched-chain amino acid ABC transporter permease [Chitinophagaceae bacterium]|nr:branched-chain amino acid ABC transporter permease [Rubrivivax sp.]